MSQHLYRMNHPTHGRIEVMAGWDRPLQGYFMSIELLDAQQDDDEVYLYSNLDDAKLEPGGMSPTFDYFERVLKRLDISVPPDMIEDILKDGREDMGNKQRHWGEEQ